jgi:hypothetical protein
MGAVVVGRRVITKRFKCMVSILHEESFSVVALCLPIVLARAGKRRVRSRGCARAVVRLSESGEVQGVVTGRPTIVQPLFKLVVAWLW